MADNSQMSAMDAYWSFRDQDMDDFDAIVALSDAGYNVKEVRDRPQSKPVQTAGQFAPTQAAADTAASESYSALLERGVEEEEARRQTQVTTGIPRDVSGEPQFSIGSDTDKPDAQAIAVQRSKEALEQGDSAFWATVGYMPLETGTEFHNRRRQLRKNSDKLLAAWEADTIDEKYQAYVAEKEKGERSKKTGALLSPIKSKQRWKADIKIDKHPDLVEWERIATLDVPDDPDFLIRETFTESALRQLSSFGSVLSGLGEGGFRGTEDVLDAAVGIAGYESFESALTDEGLGLDKEQVEAFLPEKIIIDGKEVGFAKSVDYAIARHNARGLGFIGGGGDFGESLDYLFGFRDADEEGYGNVLSLKTLFGTIGGVGELFIPLTGGIVGGTARAAKYTRALKQLEATGLATEKTRKAVKAAWSAEQKAAFQKTVSNPYKWIVAKPVDAAAAKFLDKDLKLVETLSKRTGVDLPPLDVRSLAVSEFASNSSNIKVGEYVLDVMHKASGSGVSSVEDLAVWMDKTEGVGTLAQLNTYLKSVGIKLDDAYISSWGDELVEAEKIAAVRARNLADAAPEAMKPLLGKGSPFDKALTALRAAKIADDMPDAAMKGEALALRAESWLMLQGNKKIAEAMKRGDWDARHLERVSDTVFASLKVKQESIAKVNETIGKTLRTIQSKAGGTGDDIVLTEQQKKELLKYFISSFRGFKNADARSASWIDQINSAPFSPSTKEVLLTAMAPKNKQIKLTNRHIDALWQDALSLEVAGRGITRTQIDDAISVVGKDVGVAETILAPFKATGRERYLQQYYKELFDPEELRSGRLRKYSRSIYEAVTQESGTWKGSALEEVSNFIRNRLSSSQEEMRYSIRVLRTQVNEFTGKKHTQEEAITRLLANEYTKSADEVRRNIQLAEGTGLYNTGDAGTFADTQSDYDNLFSDYLTLIFGGQENISTAFSHSGGKFIQDGVALSPSKIAGVIEGLIEASPELLKPARDEFVRLMEGGDTQAAWGLLGVVHTTIEKKTMSNIVSFRDFIVNLNESENISQILLKTNYRSVNDMANDFELVLHEAPYYLAKDQTLLMGITYFSKRAANIISEGFAKLSDIGGESIFPSARTLQMSTKADWPYRMHLVGNGLKSLGADGRFNALAKHHTKLTASSIEMGAESLLKGLSDQPNTSSKLGWQASRKAAARDLIGRPRPEPSGKYGTVYITDQKAWDDELAAIEKVLDEAYVNDIQTPWKNYKQSIIGHLRANDTGLMKQNLMNSLRSSFKEVKEFDAGVIRRSKMAGESISDLPMIFDEAADLFQDLIDAANIERRGQAKQVPFLSPMSKFDEVKVPYKERREAQDFSREIASIKGQQFQVSMLPDSNANKAFMAEGLDARLADLESRTTTLPQLSELMNRDKERSFFSWLAQRTAKESERVGLYDSSYELKSILKCLAENSSSFARSAHRTVAASGRVAKGGVLGGQFAPNITYMMMNELSAPFIITQTVGAKYAGLANIDASTVVAYSYGGFSSKAADVVAISPTNGKVYRVADVARIISENSISRGQASAELASSAAETFVKWAGRHRKGEALARYRKAIKEGKNAEFIIEQALKEANDIVGEGWELIRRNYLTSDMNVFNQVANASDARHRTGVFLRAIEEGRTEAQAIKLAQEALFDYNKLTRFERDVVNRAIWFWTFARNAMLTTFRNIIEKPVQTAALAKINRGMSKPDNYVPSEDYNESRPFLGLISDPELKRRYALYGTMLPLGSALQEIAGWTSILTPMLDDRNTAMEGVFKTIQKAAVTIGSRSTPWVKAIIGYGLDTELKFNQVRPLSNYVDPRIIYQMKQNPYIWDKYTSTVFLKAKKPSRVNENHTSFDGLVYEIADDDSKKAHYAIMQMMLQVGIQRTVRDYAPIVHSVKTATGLEDRSELELTNLQMDSRRGWVNFLMHMGIAKPQAATSETPRQRGIEQSIREHKEISR